MYNLYIYVQNIKITAFQTSSGEKERSKRLNFEFQISSFKQQISDRKYCKFQAETRIKMSK